MANASSKNFGAGAQGKGDGGGAFSELPRDMVGENDVLSNRDKSLHNEQRGLDGNQVRNQQFHDHPANRAPQDDPGERNVLPAFNDPAFSSDVPQTPVASATSPSHTPPADTEYAGHPEFSQQAAANRPPANTGLSEPAEDVEAKTRHSEGVNPKEPSAQQRTGAVPAAVRSSPDTES